MEFNLLVVDTELGIAERLREHRHRVREAKSLAAARLLLGAEVFDAVLFDAHLPDGEGIELIADIESRQPGVPSIALSSTGTVEQAVDAMRQGVFVYLRKPVD